MKYYYLFLLLITSSAFAQPPAGYYDSANGLSGYTLKSALETIIDDVNDNNGQPFHDTSVTYGDLWTLYQTSDVRPDGFVWDMYSDCDFIFGTDQDSGTGGNTECDKYNREHSFPRSWFGDDSNHPIFADPFHVIPSDKKVNSERGNLAFGEVASATYTSLNGSKIGSSSLAGPTGNVFEPANEFKGDIARGFFYLAVRYQDDIGSWEANDTDGDSMLDGSSDKVFEQWALDMLYNWHINDPVSSKELDRNNVIFGHQDNRNPFIDNPQYIFDIWQATLSTNEFAISDSVRIYPNPVKDDVFYINSPQPIDVQIYSMLGQRVSTVSINSDSNSVRIDNLPSGLYLVEMKSGDVTTTRRLVKQ
ncbi:MAG: T9SS type A sorting domain-containing protein [Flavobacteriaceae bacterium]|nr:endonuclease [Bacteroidia bacterium]MBT8286931.1 endonuclease [Bacteroidia bacterium]NNF75904.1 T9SS type A sorting domain-containing protein [Flavobacteriaceae bacterium]NNK88107.1 T9SS type A sorting domain-containing protein [Flavobacteriaceae bacterium]